MSSFRPTQMMVIRNDSNLSNGNTKGEARKIWYPPLTLAQPPVGLRGGLGWGEGAER
jgi:hypothetical protein